MRAIVSLGANLGDREEALKLALQALDTLCKTRLTAVSSFYSTEPVEVADSQPEYLNCVALLETELSPSALLGACLGIEASAGRLRQGFKSARTLDIDLLLYEGFTSESDELTVPHPRMNGRAFVLVPLAELFPDKNALGLDFAESLAAVSGQCIRRYSGGSCPDNTTLCQNCMT